MLLLAIIVITLSILGRDVWKKRSNSMRLLARIGCDLNLLELRETKVTPHALVSWEQFIKVLHGHIGVAHYESLVITKTKQCVVHMIKLWEQ